MNEEDRSIFEHNWEFYSAELPKFESTIRESNISILRMLK